MSKTRLSAVTAGLLLGASLLIFGCRWYTLGDDSFGLREASSWKVTLIATGTLSGEDSVVVVARPPDLPRQQIFDEQLHSKELMAPKAKGGNRREIVWRPAVPDPSPRPFLLSYSFRVRVGIAQTEPAASAGLREFDVPPASGELLRPTSRMESEHREIAARAAELAGAKPAASLDQLQVLYDFVAGLPNEPTLNTRSALECLRSGGGDAGDKSRLLVALCRNRGIPARLIQGLNLAEGRGNRLHAWAEAWVNEQWWPMCPTHRHFGPAQLPQRYLVLQAGDADVVRVRGGQVQYEFAVQDLHAPFSPQREPAAEPSRAKAFWQTLSLYRLNAADQHLVKFLLLLPVAALIVSVFRTIIGVPTFGIFAPALLGMMFLGTPSAGLPWAIGVFLLTVLIGWAMRHGLDRFHLLQVPRISAMLTLIVIVLLTVIVVAAHFRIMIARYITLFPLVILTHLVERFWTIEEEDSASASLRTLLGTLGAAFAVGLAVTPSLVAGVLFACPELLLLALAAQLLLGRYTGFRLAELYRFQDLLEEAREPARVS